MRIRLSLALASLALIGAGLIHVACQSDSTSPTTAVTQQQPPEADGIVQAHIPRPVPVGPGAGTDVLPRPAPVGPGDGTDVLPRPVPAGPGEPGEPGSGGGGGGGSPSPPGGGGPGRAPTPTPNTGETPTPAPSPTSGPVQVFTFTSTGAVTDPNGLAVRSIITPTGLTGTQVVKVRVGFQAVVPDSSAIDYIDIPPAVLFSRANGTGNLNGPGTGQLGTSCTIGGGAVTWDDSDLTRPFMRTGTPPFASTFRGEGQINLRAFYIIPGSLNNVGFGLRISSTTAQPGLAITCWTLEITTQ
jgi:hypothetical protein